MTHKLILKLRWTLDHQRIWRSERKKPLRTNFIFQTRGRIPKGNPCPIAALQIFKILIGPSHLKFIPYHRPQLPKLTRILKPPAQLQARSFSATNLLRVKLVDRLPYGVKLGILTARGPANPGIMLILAPGGWK